MRGQPRSMSMDSLTRHYVATSPWTIAGPRSAHPIYSSAGSENKNPSRRNLTSSLQWLFRTRGVTTRQGTSATTAGNASAASQGAFKYAWLTTLKWAIGYGHRIERALGWTIGLMFLGAIVLRISGEGPKHGLPVGLSYSFDML